MSREHCLIRATICATRGSLANAVWPVPWDFPHSQLPVLSPGYTGRTGLRLWPLTTMRLPSPNPHLPPERLDYRIPYLGAGRDEIHHHDLRYPAKLNFLKWALPKWCPSPESIGDGRLRLANRCSKLTSWRGRV